MTRPRPSTPSEEARQLETPETPEARLPLTRERVLRAAITMADEQGIASLTMRALGSRSTAAPIIKEALNRAVAL